MHQIRYFLSVARLLNITRASRELRVSQPSLTRAIQKLEVELGGPLFRRERSNTYLTTLGRTMLPHLEAAFASAEAAKDLAIRLRKGEAGALALGICAEIEPDGPAAAIMEATATMSDLEVTIVVASGEVVENRLMAGDFDAAVLARLADDHRFRTCQIGADAMVVAFPEGHRFADGGDGAELELAALQDEALVVRSDSVDEEALAHAMSELGIRRHVRHRVDGARWLADLVRRGQGCAVVPMTLARAHALAHRPLGGVDLRHCTVLATVPGRPHPPALARLVQQVCGTVQP